jgi:Periplasmic copper-binding protein (NosD)
VFDSNKNLIKKNVFSRNGPAVLMEKADRNEVQRNRVTRGGGILVAPGNRNVIARNRVSRALDSIAIDKGSGNLIAGNVVVRARKAGIRLGLVVLPTDVMNTADRRPVSQRAVGPLPVVVAEKGCQCL